MVFLQIEWSFYQVWKLDAKRMSWYYSRFESSAMVVWIIVIYIGISQNFLGLSILKRTICRLDKSYSVSKVKQGFNLISSQAGSTKVKRKINWIRKQLRKELGIFSICSFTTLISIRIVRKHLSRWDWYKNIFQTTITIVFSVDLSLILT